MARGRKRILIASATLVAGVLTTAATVVSMSRDLSMTYASPTFNGGQSDLKLSLSGGRLWVFFGGGTSQVPRTVSFSAHAANSGYPYSGLFFEDPRWANAKQFAVGAGGTAGGMGWVVQWVRVGGMSITQGLVWPLAPGLLLSGAAFLYWGLRTHRRAQSGAGCCEQCGYDLSGTAAGGACPECGAAGDVKAKRPGACAPRL